MSPVKLFPFSLFSFSDIGGDVAILAPFALFKKINVKLGEMEVISTTETDLSNGMISLRKTPSDNNHNDITIFVLLCPLILGGGVYFLINREMQISK